MFFVQLVAVKQVFCAFVLVMQVERSVVMAEGTHVPHITKYPPAASLRACVSDIIKEALNRQCTAWSLGSASICTLVLVN